MSQQMYIYALRLKLCSTEVFLRVLLPLLPSPPYLPMYTQASDLLQVAAPLSTHPYWVAVSLLSFAVSGFIALSAVGKPACNVPYVKSWYYFGPPNWTLSTYRFIVKCVKDHGGLFTFRFRNVSLVDTCMYDVVLSESIRWMSCLYPVNAGAMQSSRIAALTSCKG
jgi:hypothetical protein